MNRAPAKLVLADGTVFSGVAFGAEAVRGGEVVFNTAHTGYQEVITDPSYAGQIVCMTCPQQGNYGVNDDDHEADRLFIDGFIVRELSAVPSNFRSTRSLDEMLRASDIPAIAGVNTRALTLQLRAGGAINGVLSTAETDEAKLLERARALPSMVGADLVKRVAAKDASEWSPDADGLFAPPPIPPDRHVVAIDCGMKRNILRNLAAQGCRVTIAPPTLPAAEILALRPDGVFVSNGPGDPAPVTYVQAALRELVPHVPVFGICLGHQLLALALGAKTYKLKFGHHGCNHPVKNLLTGRVEITSQNHGFAVEEASMPAAGIEMTHVNLYDQTIEGFRHREFPAFAVQYHPEAAPGPHDAAYLFDVFRRVMETRRPPTTDDMTAAQDRLRSSVAAVAATSR